MTIEDSKSKAGVSETPIDLPKEIETLGLSRWFERKVAKGEVARIETDLVLEDWVLSDPGFENMRYSWVGDKTHPAAVGYPFITTSADRTFDPATHAMEVSVRHDLGYQFSFGGKPLIVLGYDETTHCLIVVRGDVYVR